MGGLIDLPLRAAFSPAHPLADIFHPPYPPIASQSISRDVPLARARAFRSSSPFVKGVAEAALSCAHRTSTVSPCAFCEQEGHLVAPFPSFLGRALREHRRSSGSIPSSAPGAKYRRGYRSIPFSCVPVPREQETNGSPFPSVLCARSTSKKGGLVAAYRRQFRPR
jgi:hypothetical protein